MRLRHLIIAVTAVFTPFFGVAANAETCAWSVSRFESSATADPMTLQYACRANDSTKAVKTIVVTVDRAPTCSIELAAGWKNQGTCFAPKVLIESSPNACPGTNPSGYVYARVDLANSRAVNSAVGAAPSYCSSCTASVRSTGVQSQGEVYCK